jgi:hypothetical protein
MKVFEILYHRALTDKHRGKEKKYITRLQGFLDKVGVIHVKRGQK